MKLHEFHVAELGPRAKGHGVAVRRGDRRVGRLAEELAGAAGGQHDGPGPDQREPAAAIPDQDAPALAFVRDQVDRDAVLPDPDVRVAPGLRDDRPHDLAAGLVAQRVGDPCVRVAPFAPQGDVAVDFVEMRPPVDQLADPAGCFADDHLDDLGVAQALAGRQRVGDVVVKPVVGIEHAGDAPLGVVAVALAHLVLGDGEHAVIARGFPAQTETRDPAADDQHIGEMMRKFFGVKADEVPAR